LQIKPDCAQRSWNWLSPIRPMRSDSISRSIKKLQIVPALQREQEFTKATVEPVVHCRQRCNHQAPHEIQPRVGSIQNLADGRDRAGRIAQIEPLLFDRVVPGRAYPKLER